MGAAAQQDAWCNDEEQCDNDTGLTLAGSTDTYSYRCNDSAVEALEGFDLRNWIWWEDTVIDGAMTACTADSDCSAGMGCGTLTNS